MVETRGAGKGADTGGWAAFLRGVNVGGRHRVPMPELRALFEELGAREVRSYIQSGNVVFRAEASQAAAIERGFAGAAEARFAFPVPAAFRSARELDHVLRNNPFLASGVEEKALHVLFLQREPEPDAVAALDPERSPPDAFAVRGRDVYLHLPHGMARTRLTNAYVDRVLGTTSTARNWRTVRAVAQMLS